MKNLFTSEFVTEHGQALGRLVQSMEYYHVKSFILNRLNVLDSRLEYWEELILIFMFCMTRFTQVD